MNLEDARKVYWLNTKHRPIGELFDEGLITRPDLEWAAKKAFDPTLKQAAQVILESGKYSVSSPVAEEKKNGFKAHPGIKKLLANWNSFGESPRHPLALWPKQKPTHGKVIGFKADYTERLGKDG
jgi:hypothetical protein